MSTLGILPLIMLLLGGPMGNDLLDYVDTAVYWETKGIVVSAPVMQEELGPTTVAPGHVPALIRDLGSSSFKKREAATAQLSQVGAPALPELKKAAKSDDVETAARAKELIAALSVPEKAKEVRRLMAIRTLGEIGNRKSLPMLRKLADSKDFFTADYAKSAIAAIEGKEYEREGVADGDMAFDLARLPGSCRAVAQVRLQGGKPVDYAKLFGDIQKMMGEMGGGPDVSEMIQQISGTVITVAESVGNIRITAATIGLADIIDGDDGFAALVVRGQCNAKSIRAALRAKNLVPFDVDGVQFFSLEDEMAFGPATDNMFVGGFGPSRVAIPLAALASAAKSDKPRIRLDKSMQALIKKTDTTKALWGVAAMTESYRKIPMLGPVFDTVRLTGTSKDKHMSLELIAVGSDAEKVKAVVDDARHNIDQTKAQMMQHAEQGPRELMMKETVKPILDFLSSVKMNTDGNTATVTAKIEADPSAIMALPFMFFGIALERPVHAEPMPVEIPDQE